MARTSFDRMSCSIARTVDVIGDPWTPLVLRDIAIGITRFDALQHNTDISRKVLTDRLSKLVAHGVVERQPYQHNPIRYDYFLTEKGADLAGVLLAMQTWADRWVFGDKAVPLLLRHDPCGKIVKPVVTCSGCGEPLEPADVTPLPGPGSKAVRGTRLTREALDRLLAARSASA